MALPVQKADVDQCAEQRDVERPRAKQEVRMEMEIA